MHSIDYATPASSPVTGVKYLNGRKPGYRKEVTKPTLGSFFKSARREKDPRNRTNKLISPRWNNRFVSIITAIKCGSYSAGVITIPARPRRLPPLPARPPSRHAAAERPLLDCAAVELSWPSFYFALHRQPKGCESRAKEEIAEHFVDLLTQIRRHVVSLKKC